MTRFNTCLQRDNRVCIYLISYMNLIKETMTFEHLQRHYKICIMQKDISVSVTKGNVQLVLLFKKLTFFLNL